VFFLGDMYEDKIYVNELTSSPQVDFCFSVVMYITIKVTIYCR